VIDHVRPHLAAPAAHAPVPATPAPVTPVPMPIASAPAPVTRVPAPMPIASAPAPITPVLAADPAALAHATDTLLEVVTELTGYPRETLELEMDMESDLGIDSIKRVQILGAMQERLTNLPAFKPETLAELRTLGQVIDHVRPHLAAPAAHAPIPATPAPVTRVPAPMPIANIPGAERSVPRLVALPPPDALECALPAGACCVLTDDGTAAVAELARALRARGWPAVVLRLPTALVPTHTTLPADVSRVVLQDTSEAQLDQALRSISESYGPIGAFIHLHPRASAPALLDPTDQAIVRQIFLIARAIGPALRSAAEIGRSCFLTVTRMDGALGTAQRGDYGAVPGGLAGLTKTLRHEWPQVFCRAIDLSPEFDSAQVAGLIMAELHDPDRLLAEVGYGLDGRVTLSGAAGQL
jgi:NAD(P)-dependent dehydrogenase (short-subunit alcohol dehydrogenase family)/acyl carrier protein